MIRAIGLLGFVFMGAGCSSNHLVYVQESSLGLNLGVSGEGMQKLSIGYDRDVFAVVPKKKDESDAMSLFSLNNIEVKGLDDINVSEFVAAGAPAISLTSDNQAVAKLRKKIYEKNEGDENED